MATKEQLESDLRALQAFRESAFMTEILRDNREQQDALVTLLCGETINSVESFFAHFEAIGHLRGLRRMPGLLEDRLAELELALKTET